MQHACIQAGLAGPTDHDQSTAFERAAAIAGAAALCLALATVSLAPQDAALPLAAMVDAAGAGADSRPGARGAGLDDAAGRETLAGGYLGVTYTHPSNVNIENPGRTSMSVKDVAWEGKPFKSPIYYGLRVIRWARGGRIGTLVDFTHAKAISRFEDTASFTGTYEGKPLPASGKLGDTFKHLEFSHGHNMLTLNGLLRLGNFPVQPYVGAGAGISLPHTEIGFRAEKGRTYEYQYAGLAGQVLAGLEFRLGRSSVFVEYKFSYAPYDVPLSGVVDGSWLFIDLWRQFRAWISGEKPPGGRLTTPLMSHHGIGGVMVRVAPRLP